MIQTIPVNNLHSEEKMVMLRGKSPREHTGERGQRERDKVKGSEGDKKEGQDKGKKGGENNGEERSEKDVRRKNTKDDRSCAEEIM